MNQTGGPQKIFVSIVLDGLGIGDGPDADAYGDVGSDTLGHICTVQRPHLPNLERFGLGRIRPLDGVESVSEPLASFGQMTEVAPGKDSTAGHWELAGVVQDRPFPLYPDGFPEEVIDNFCQHGRVKGVLGNRPESGTVIIEEYGAQHQRTGQPIIYTSGDSVFQIAAHIEAISLEDLYRLCTVARDQVCVGEHAVGRVIARPFEGSPGSYRRLSHARKDFSLKPPRKTIQEMLRETGIQSVSVGKIGSLFGGVGFDIDMKTNGNEDGVEKTLDAVRTAARTCTSTFIWTNLVDFDELYGHRNDSEGYARALEAFDHKLPELTSALPDRACLLLTADHGNDPTFPGSDHTRERVPLLLYEKGDGGGRDLGTRSTFADHAATIAEYFGITYEGPGKSFW